MDLIGKRLLVIGGAGLIGSHTVDRLCKEDVAEVLVYDNFTRGKLENLSTALDDPRVKIFDLGGDVLHTDILDAAMKEIDGVFLFAALWLLHCHDFPRSAFHVNIEGTFNVVEAMLNNGVKRLVYSSSASVYGDAVREPMDEDHPYMNKTFYGATKIASEHIIRSLHHRHRDTSNGFDYVGLRYMNVYGPRQDYRGAYIAVIMRMLDRIEDGEPLVIHGDGSQAYDFVFVEDCAEANVLSMGAEATDSFYNVGSGIKVSIKELAETILDLTGSSVGIQFEPAGLTFVKNRIGSTERAHRDLGFKARVELREGLQKVIDWRKSRRES